MEQISIEWKPELSEGGDERGAAGLVGRGGCGLFSLLGLLWFRRGLEAPREFAEEADGRCELLAARRLRQSLLGRLQQLPVLQPPSQQLYARFLSVSQSLKRSSDLALVTQSSCRSRAQCAHMSDPGSALHFWQSGIPRGYFSCRE